MQLKKHRGLEKLPRKAGTKEETYRGTRLFGVGSPLLPGRVEIRVHGH
jgi:hypothetical protein